jgi:hypothetical protein
MPIFFTPNRYFLKYFIIQINIPDNSIYLGQQPYRLVIAVSPPPHPVAFNLRQSVVLLIPSASHT